MARTSATPAYESVSASLPAPTGWLFSPVAVAPDSAASAAQPGASTWHQRSDDERPTSVTRTAAALAKLHAAGSSTALHTVPSARMTASCRSSMPSASGVHLYVASLNGVPNGAVRIVSLGETSPLASP